MKYAVIAVVAAALSASAQAEPLTVPAFTAYIDANGGSSAHVSQKSGITAWKSPDVKVLWFGEIKTPGKLDCSVSLRLPEKAASNLRLTVGKVSHDANAVGLGKDLVTVSFGSFDIAEAGYQRFTLESLNAAGTPAGDLESLILDGPAIKDAHFNLKERRNTASVHLSYPSPKGVKVDAFYAEATAVEDPVATYYEVCGWSRGYFGMQVNGPNERRIIFSVWDSGGEAVDRKKVADHNRVTLLAKGEGVSSGDFGNEGTGGHSHLVYAWKTGEVQKFYMTAKPVDGTYTIYSGYYYHPEKKQWMLISSWKAPKDGKYLSGLYSFSENFGGNNGHLRRKALFGNQWIRSSDGQWTEITTASFSHDGTGGKDRLDRFMGVENGQFFLSSGGFVKGFTKYGELFTRPATGKSPADILLPEIQAIKDAQSQPAK